MAEIDKNGLGLSNQFRNNLFHIVKSRKEFYCYECNKTLPKGTTYFGGLGWYASKTCYSCMFEIHKRNIESFKKWIKDFETSIKYVEENKEGWDKELFIHSL